MNSCGGFVWSARCFEPGEVPSDDEEQPCKTERVEVIEFLLPCATREAAKARRNTVGKMVMRRLTDPEYNNTINDLLALDEN